MRWLCCTCLCCLPLAAAANDRSTAQDFLHSGQLSQGEQSLAAELVIHPHDDQARFGLAIIQLVQGIERLGQALHFYGAKPSRDLFLRLPVPENDQPAVINDYRFRRVLDDFGRDLMVTEGTLAQIAAEDVRFPLKLADITFDFNSDGKPTDKFRDVLLKLFNNRRFDFQQVDPDFLVVFDRGDVAWLRAYCHLLAGIIDFYLSVKTEAQFDLWADQAFARPQRPFQGADDERWKKSREQQTVVIHEPLRLGRFRKHLIALTDLNEETWKFIRLETDDDHEWLPNSKQKGVLGLSVQDAQIDRWLTMMAELRRLLDGERTFPSFFGNEPPGRELNWKVLLDEPPEKFVFDGGFPRNLGDKYFTQPAPLNLAAFFAVLQMFSDPALMGYPVWFN